MQVTRDAVVEAAGLRRVFRAEHGELVAVESVDLAIPAGIVFGFLGPNGAGKSTTIRMLVTLLAPSAGRAAVAGFDVGQDPAEVRRRIGYVAQGGSASAVETGREELVMQARSFGGSRHDAERRTGELITRFQLAEVADRRTGGWSGGQCRRLDIALGLVHRPSVLFLDEPTTGLDPQSRANLWEQIGRLRDDGVTIFLTTHYLEEADALAERIAIIDHGRIVAEGTPGDLKRQISGDVIEIGVGSCPGRALAVLQAQPFVRSAALAQGVVRPGRAMRWPSDLWLTYRRAMIERVRVPAWVVVSLAQPLLYLFLFGPLLKNLRSAPATSGTSAYDLFVPGLLVLMAYFVAGGAGFGLLEELTAGVIERLRVTPSAGRPSCSDQRDAT